MRWIVLAAAAAVLAACEAEPMNRYLAADLCEDQARAAQGPTGQITLGANSRGRNYAGAEIGITSDFLAGRDPVDVYESCVIRRTGQEPVRPPVLRRT